MLPRSARFAKRNRRQPAFFSILGVLFLLGIVGFLSISNVRLYQRKMDLSGQVDILQNEVGKLEQHNKKLQNRLEEAGTQEYLERTARERLNLKKPGEEVVAIIAPREGGEEQEQQEEKNLWQKIIDPIRNFFEQKF